MRSNVDVTNQQMKRVKEGECMSCTDVEKLAGSTSCAYGRYIQLAQYALQQCHGELIQTPTSIFTSFHDHALLPLTIRHEEQAEAAGRFSFVCVRLRAIYY